MKDALRIVGTDDPPGVCIVDDVQGVQTRLALPTVPTLEPCSADRFAFPIDAAVRLDATEVRVPHLVNVIVRDADATIVAEVANRGRAAIEYGSYTVEIHSLSVVTYLHVEGRLVVGADGGERVIAVGDGGHVRLGVRSRHEHPAATVTTTADPVDVMRALSTLGSALKTTSPERSWPSLRGHPPFVELGDRLDGPSALLDREYTTTLELPPTFEYVFPASSLAYYLDAEVRPGETPRLLLDGSAYDLEAEVDYETAVHRTLRQVFLLDCVTRTEGYYPVELDVRARLERRLDLDFADLYDRPLADRTAAYLDVPFEALADELPTWKQTADVAPTAEHVAFLPILAADLALVRCPPVRSPSEAEVPAAIADFFRTESRRTDPASVLVRDAGRVPRTRQGEDAAADRIVVPPPSETIEHTWIGDGYPVTASKPTIDACKRRLAAKPSGSIEVAVVSNSPEMRAENDVSDYYGLREFVEFDVALYEDLTRDELAALFASGLDFVHYVGHVDERGMQCSDGYLDAGTLDAVETRAFVLNACNSYEQGMRLVHAGSIAGVVTASRVANDPATRVGRTLARLLNAGFSLAGALDIVSTATVTGQQYGAVGDAQLALTDSAGGTPIMADLDRRADGRYDVCIRGYPTPRVPLGTLYTPYVGNNERRYLNSGRIAEFTVTRSQLEEFLTLERFPVRYGDALRWSDRLLADGFELDAE
ncbi:caspase family protein [Halomarina pelagica]|uniref:caspase family protein n=1 Tax=Halomarina pelagica TaxID=2961599 RepID=UPI0020C32AF4|nr:caspase family protein [Halomarina sp. BND7]